MKNLALPLILVWLVGLGALSGCGQSILRDDYMGKSLFQPDNIHQTVRRDGDGNPILEDKAKPKPPPRPVDSKGPVKRDHLGNPILK